jgi:hypothetical protein
MVHADVRMPSLSWYLSDTACDNCQGSGWEWRVLGRVGCCRDSFLCTGCVVQQHVRLVCTSPHAVHVHTIAACDTAALYALSWPASAGWSCCIPLACMLGIDGLWASGVYDTECHAVLL